MQSEPLGKWRWLHAAGTGTRAGLRKPEGRRRPVSQGQRGRTGSREVKDVGSSSPEEQRELWLRGKGQVCSEADVVGSWQVREGVVGNKIKK